MIPQVTYLASPFFFFLSLYVFSPKGALGYEAELASAFFLLFFSSLWAFSPKGALGNEAGLASPRFFSFSFGVYMPFPRREP